LKIKFLLLITLLVSTLNANQNPYILLHDGLMDQRAQDKVFEIGNEVKTKLQANLYVYIIENNGINPKEERELRKSLMKIKENEIIEGLEKPYAVLTLAIDQMYANILISEDLEDILDKDDILNNYVIPLLASKDKNTLFAKTSAAVLNGYAQMADSIAKSKDIKLASSIGSEGKTASTVWRVFMYTLVVTGLVLYIVVILREKKYKKGSKSGK